MFTPLLRHAHIACRSCDRCDHRANCPELRELDVSHAFDVSDAGLDALAGGCKQLAVLGVGGTAATKAGLETIVANCLDLRELAIYDCRMLTDEEVDEFEDAHSSPKLTIDCES